MGVLFAQPARLVSAAVDDRLGPAPDPALAVWQRVGCNSTIPPLPQASASSSASRGFRGINATTTTPSHLFHVPLDALPNAHHLTVFPTRQFGASNRRVDNESSDLAKGRTGCINRLAKTRAARRHSANAQDPSENISQNPHTASRKPKNSGLGQPLTSSAGQRLPRRI